MLKLKRILSNFLSPAEARITQSGDHYSWCVPIDGVTPGLAKISVLPNGALFEFGVKIPEGKHMGNSAKLLRFRLTKEAEIADVSGQMAKGFEADRNGMLAMYHKVIASSLMVKN